jgi:hypothetical protein
LNFKGSLQKKKLAVIGLQKKDGAVLKMQSVRIANTKKLIFTRKEDFILVKSV